MNISPKSLSDMQKLDYAQRLLKKANSLMQNAVHNSDRHIVSKALRQVPVYLEQVGLLMKELP